jgi:hypothetical protein
MILSEEGTHIILRWQMFSLFGQLAGKRTFDCTFIADAAERYDARDNEREGGTVLVKEPFVSASLWPQQLVAGHPARIVATLFQRRSPKSQLDFVFAIWV